jgi:rhamnosyltransferase
MKHGYAANGCKASEVLSQLHVIIPTLNAGALWPLVIKGILDQRLDRHSGIDVWVVDSQSSDETVRLASQAGFTVDGIEREHFAHGSTRQDAFERLPQDAQWVIFMTQDAVLKDPHAFEELLKPFEDPKVSASFGRQLPHPDATWLAGQLRAFNYPSKARVSGFEDRFELGLKAIFLSNSFAAYRVSSFKAVGGFSRSTILGEDMLLAAKLLKDGGRVAYAPTAQVLHSHNDTLLQEFQRYFDTGVMHQEEKELLKDFGGVNSHGWMLLIFLIKQLKGVGTKAFVVQLGHICLRSMMKLVAYHLGTHHGFVPRVLKRSLSMSKNHWKP